jgi:hypothetical protein
VPLPARRRGDSTFTLLCVETFLEIRTAERALRGRAAARRRPVGRMTRGFSASPWTTGSRANGLTIVPGTRKPPADGVATRRTFVPPRGSRAARHR